jgi:hypothetical protein
LESTFKDYPNSWTVLTKKLVGEVIIEQFKIAKNKYLNENGSDLSYNNYFKNVTHMKDLMNVKISSSIRAMGGAVFIID